MSYLEIILLIAGASSFAAGVILLIKGIRWSLYTTVYPRPPNLDAEKGRLAIGIGIILSVIGIACLFWAIMLLSG